MIRSLALLAAAALGAAVSSLASAHDAFASMYAPAGYKQDVEMRVYHGCKGSPVNQLRIKIPETVSYVSVENRPDWTVEIKTRKLAKPVSDEVGRLITEVVDEIIWSKPKSALPPSRMFEGFRFRVGVPDSPGAILFFKTITGCEQGDDKYVDLPKEPLDVNAKDFQKKIWAFMTATPGPAPFLILEKPARPQYPWGDADKAPATSAPKPAGAAAAPAH